VAQPPNRQGPIQNPVLDTMLNSPAILCIFSILLILSALLTSTSYQPFPSFTTSLFSSAHLLKYTSRTKFYSFIPQLVTKKDYVFPIHADVNLIHDFFMNLALQQGKDFGFTPTKIFLKIFSASHHFYFHCSEGSSVKKRGSCRCCFSVV
jgi:hypothetical protein